MALRSGLGSQLGFGVEGAATYGTYAVPTRFLEFRSESLTFNRGTIDSTAIRSGVTMARTGRWALNNKGGGGTTAFEVSTTAFGLIFKHALGAVAITTPGGATLARLHTYTFGDLDELSLTIQKGVPIQSDGTVTPWNFVGSVCTDWTMSCSVDELLTFDATWDSQNMQVSSPLAAASFGAGEVYGYTQVGISVDSSAKCVRSLVLNCTNGVDTDRYCMSATGLKRRPVIAAFRELTGTITLDFDSMTEANYYLNATPGAEVPIVVTATHGDFIEAADPYSLTATMPECEFTEGGTPTVSGPDLVTLDLGFRVRDNGTDEPLTLAYKTSDTAV